ncbi:MAG: GFA family protein [bacterium]|nr:GFA family protein [Gammaproteobacteria bacterium]
MNNTVLHSGSCHCGAVIFEFETAPEVLVNLCNCSICELVGYQHLIVPRDYFRLLSDQHNLSLYTFNSGVAKHYFCKVCGIKSWYVPRSNPDGVSVNFRCVDKDSFDKVTYEEFDGQNWEANASSLSHLSDPSS